MCVVAPGRQPQTEIEKVLSTSSGHIIHLMPGDNNYDPSSFCIVLAWNGLNHYTPTYIMKHSSILQHRCSVISRLLSTATDLFSDIESELDESKDEDLIDQFHNLRDQTVQANHLLAIKGLEKPKLPPSVGGPHPNDVKSHLTRKTPLPAHPEPLIAHALQHPLDPDSALRRAHPTPYMQPPPAAKDIKEEDFQIKLEDYQTDQARCIKVPGQIAPGKLLHSKKELLVHIQLPLDPVKGHPPAQKDSIGAKRFRQDFVPPPGDAELAEIVQNLPNHWITQENQKEGLDVPSSSQGKSSQRIPQATDTEESEVIDVDKDLPPGRITRKSSQKPCICPPSDAQLSDRITHTVVIPDDESSSSQKAPGKFSVTSETIEEVTIEIEDDDNTEKLTSEKKLRSLKRKFIPSRKSPRITIPKLDMQAGVKTALDEKKKTVVESLAKGIVSKIKPQGLPTDKSKGDQPSSSSTSSQSSLKQKTILQIYAQAARRIPQNSKNKPVPAAHPVSQRKSASQGSAGDFPPPPPPPRRIMQSQPPPGQITQSQPPPEPHQIAQSQPAPGQSQPVKRWIAQPSVAPARRVLQADPTKGPILSCTFCKYTTLRKESLNDHIKMHTGEKVYCDQCDKSYFTKKVLRIHIKNTHLKLDRCCCTEPGCTWSGKDYGLRKVHLYESHGIGRLLCVIIQTAGTGDTLAMQEH